MVTKVGSEAVNNLMKKIQSCQAYLNDKIKDLYRFSFMVISVEMTRNRQMARVPIYVK